MPDGGTDAGPDAPSAPVVHIEPASPTTLDDLSVVIDTDSIDPLDAGTITYQYRWLRDDADSGETGTSVSHDGTAKGQVWQVEVTPMTTDGRAGSAGTAQVTIQNTPPTIQTIGLSTYRPISGDVLSAFSPVTEDVDGDTLTVHYRWLGERDGCKLHQQSLGPQRDRRAGRRDDHARSARVRR